MRASYQCSSRLAVCTASRISQMPQFREEMITECLRFSEDIRPRSSKKEFAQRNQRKSAPQQIFVVASPNICVTRQEHSSSINCPSAPSIFRVVIRRVRHRRRHQGAQHLQRHRNTCQTIPLLHHTSQSLNSSSCSLD